MNLKTEISAVIATIGGGLSYLLGGWDTLIMTLAIFMVLDYVTGMIASYKSKQWNSEKGSIGLLKKATIVLVVILGVSLDRLVGQTIFRNLVCMFYIANEGLSIIENCGNIGLPVPQGLIKALEQLNKKEESNDKGAE